MAEMVPFAEIAKRLKVNHGTVGRLIKRYGEELHLVVHQGKGVKLLLSKEDAEKLIARHQARLSPLAINSEEAPKVEGWGWGYFYVIQLVPEALPNRVKIGIADSVEKRLAEHRTAAPTAKLLKSWPCKRSHRQMLWIGA